MLISQHHIKTTKTARFFSLGDFRGASKHLWIVAHGYMQLGSDFIKLFEPIAGPETIIIAPEGLARFYTRGFGGNIGASWMTKEDRENEISDYVEYLDSVLLSALDQLESPPSQITLLGFSQGCPTVMRWTALGKVIPDQVILWCGDAPTDLDFTCYIAKMSGKTTSFVSGLDDKIVPKATQEMSLKLLTDKGLKTDLISFQGSHEIPAQILKDLKLRLRG